MHKQVKEILQVSVSQGNGGTCRGIATFVHRGRMQLGSYCEQLMKEVP